MQHDEVWLRLSPQGISMRGAYELREWYRDGTRKGVLNKRPVPHLPHEGPRGQFRYHGWRCNRVEEGRAVNILFWHEQPQDRALLENCVIEEANVIALIFCNLSGADDGCGLGRGPVWELTSWQVGDVLNMAAAQEFTDAFYEFLRLSTPSEIKAKFESVIDMPTSRNRPGIIDAHRIWLKDAFDKKIAGKEPDLYRKVQKSECPGGLDIPGEPGWVIETVEVEIDGNKYLIGETISALVQVLGCALRATTDEEAQAKLVVAYWLSSLLFPENLLPVVWSAVSFGNRRSQSKGARPSAQVEEMVAGVNTPGQYEVYGGEKRALSRKHKATMASLMPSHIVQRMRTVENAQNEHERVTKHITEVIETGNCAETIIFLWICRVLNNANRRADLQSISIRMVTIRKNNLADWAHNFSNGAA
ncbi:hypothetical protein CALCODRAFT_509371 [Calocera cornea HHB12733]|uniref:Uncharacterized protein n=1 Tax=Calocera cornea HHB12733 TaxID=1353952 RepID=A0A165FDS8_9BASI|nr:hypothetical protein CALCODRAFT_509371 [Calocera cornea HHB12733]